MKLSTLALFVCFVLAACTPVEGGSAPQVQAGDDPQALIDRGNLFKRQTQEAGLAQIAQATQQAAQDQRKSRQEQDRLMFPITATAGAINLQSTAGAATQQSAQATSTATAAVATAVYMASRATETRQAEISKETYNYWSGIGWNIFWGMVIVGGTGAGVYIAYLLIKRWEDERIKRENDKAEVENRRALMFSAGDGKYYFLAPGGPIYLDGATAQAVVPAASYSVSQDGFIPMESARPGSASGNGHQDTNSLAQELALKSLRKFGDNSDQLAGWRLMNWSPSKWQRVAKALDYEGLIETIVDENDSGKKKVILANSSRGGFPNLRAFYNALNGGALTLHPAPASSPPYPEIDD